MEEKEETKPDPIEEIREQWRPNRHWAASISPADVETLFAEIDRLRARECCPGCIGHE